MLGIDRIDPLHITSLYRVYASLSGVYLVGGPVGTDWDHLAN